MAADPSRSSTAELAGLSPEAGARAIHGSFTQVLRLAAAPGRVFAAFCDLPVRQQWFRIPSLPGTAHHELDFRVGGHEIMRGTFAAAGPPEQVEYRSQFFDIVTDERIVFVFEQFLNGLRRSVSLATVELAPDTGGTCLTYTESFVFVVLTGDGSADVAERQGGTRLLFNRLHYVIEHDASV